MPEISEMNVFIALASFFDMLAFWFVSFAASKAIYFLSGSTRRHEAYDLWRKVLYL